MSIHSCHNEIPANKTIPYPPGSFGHDWQFLQQYDSVIVLQQEDAAIIVSAKYQGKVFTSTASGNAGTSFGWINYKAFDGPPDPHMNAYGGENRLWLGPEGGRYSLYFQPGDSMVFDKWKTPAPFDTEAWKIRNHSSTSVLLQKAMQLTNYTGAVLSIQLSRSITILSQQETEKQLAITIDSSIRYVGYSTKNRITNMGEEAWTEQTGMPCIWMLDMLRPSDSTVIVIPYRSPLPDSKAVNTTYFGEIANDRISQKNNTVFFKADGKSRGKLGIHPAHVLPVAGSYDVSQQILTITTFSVDAHARYLNQEWNTSAPVFSGDAMNAYNDGPLADGSQMGPFYEIESVSPAAALEPGTSLHHDHDVFHFTGDSKGLNEIALKVLGVSLKEIQHAFIQ